MSKPTPVAPGGVVPAASPGFRVVYHPPVCPECHSADVTTGDVETTDGLTETALFCRACGDVWPLACVTDWGGAR